MELMKDVARATFLRERRKGIGGSDVAAIFGLDPYRTPEELWLEKTGQLIPVDEPSGDKERGIRLEPIAAEMYMERTGTSLYRVKTPLKHPDHPWMIGNIDRLILPPGRLEGAATKNRIAEIKCPSLGMFAKIKREGLPYRWTLQAQHYLAISGLDEVVWIIFCADRWEMIDFTVERDELLIERIIEKEREFWMFVETMSPPPNVAAEVQDQKIVVVGNVTKRSDEEFIDAVNNLREAAALAKTGEELKEAARERILELVENKPGIYSVAGIGRVNFQQRAGRRSLDTKKLENSRPIDRDKLFAVLAQTRDFISIDELNRAAMQGGLDLNLDDFYKQGDPFADFRFFGSKGE